MRSILILSVVALLMVSAGAAWATMGTADGLINGPLGGTGYFNEIHVGGTATSANFVETSGAWDLNAGNFVVFDYDDNTWINSAGAFVQEQNPLAVRCDIEMYAREHLDATNIYFHIGDGETNGAAGPVMTAYVGGWFKSNNGQWIGITKDNMWGATDGPKYVNGAWTNKAAELKFTKDGLGRTTPTAADTPIPLEIAFNDAGDGQNYRVIAATGNAIWDAGTGGNWGYYWLVNGGLPSFQQYTFRFRITPKYHQGDGRYDLDPTVVLTPAL
jgi:hypothetical protein